MIPPKYKFYIVVGSSSEVEVTPHFKELNKKYAKESGQEFFRISLDGKITLFADDYELINGASLETKLVFIIKKYNNTYNTWDDYYEGEFNKTDCKFNHAKKSCEIKTTPVDEYTEIINKYDNTYDLIKLAPELTKIKINKRPLIQVYVLGSSSISNFFGGTYWEADVNEVIDSVDDIIQKYHFSRMKTANEFRVTNAPNSSINGIYAGTDGNWKNSGNSYSIYAQETGDNMGVLYLKRNSDNKNLYASSNIIIRFDQNNVYIPFTGNIELTALEGSTGTCILTDGFIYDIYQRTLCDVDTITDSEGDKSTYDIPLDDFAINNGNYKKCIGLIGNTFICSAKVIDSPTKFGQNDFGKYFTDQVLSSITGVDRVLPICRSIWANASLWYAYDIMYNTWERKMRKEYTLKDSYSIAATIKVLLNQIDPSITHEATAEYSRFLYDTNVPLSGMTRFYVHIAQKTNILKGNYDQAAQKAEISFEELMNMLRDCFRCYWYIENGKLKIEHISFFMNGGSYSEQAGYQLDFTKLTDQFNKRLTSSFQAEVEYDKSELNQRYEFGWMDDVTDLFGQVTADVNSNYIQKDKTEEITIGQFSSDVDFMLFNPSNFSEDGFALLCPIKDSTGYILPIVDVDNLIDENNNTYDATVQNWYASWIYLIRFYMYDMPAYNIKVNVLGNQYAIDIKKCMKQTIEFPTENDLDELKLVKTFLGNGKIDEISINIDTRMAKVNLLYKPS